MANNRIYIECDNCKQYIFFFKYYPSCAGYFYPEGNEMCEFIAEHLYKCNNNENFLDCFPFTFVIDTPSGKKHETDGTHKLVYTGYLDWLGVTEEELKKIGTGKE